MTPPPSKVIVAGTIDEEVWLVPQRQLTAEELAQSTRTHADLKYREASVFVAFAMGSAATLLAFEASFVYAIPFAALTILFAWNGQKSRNMGNPLTTPELSVARGKLLDRAIQTERLVLGHTGIGRNDIFIEWAELRIQSKPSGTIVLGTAQAAQITLNPAFDSAERATFIAALHDRKTAFSGVSVDRSSETAMKALLHKTKS